MKSIPAAVFSDALVDDFDILRDGWVQLGPINQSNNTNDFDLVEYDAVFVLKGSLELTSRTRSSKFRWAHI